MRTRRSILCFLLGLLLAIPALAGTPGGESRYGRVEGRVYGKYMRSKAEGVIVKLLERGGRRPLAQVQSDREGRFVLRAPEGEYDLALSHLSYRPLTQSITVRGGETVTLPPIELEERDETLDEVVVTTTRTARHLQDIPVPTAVIGKTDLQQIVPTSMQDILSYTIPGFQYTNFGYSQTLSIQGLSGGYTTFLINGEEMAGLKGGAIDLERLDPSNIERIEIVRGGGSALYGSNAISGVINFITKKPIKPWSAEVTTGYNPTFGQWYSSLSAALSREKWSATTFVTHHRSGGYTIGSKKYDNEREVRPNVVTALSSRLSYRPLKALKLGLDLHGSHRVQIINDERNDHYDSFGGSLSATYQISHDHSLQAKSALDCSLRRRFYPQTTPLEVELKHRNLKMLHRLQWDATLGYGGDLNAGVEYREERMLSDQIAETSAEKKIANSVLFAQLTSGDLLGDLSAMIGCRGDYHSRYGLHISPKVNLLYKWHDVSMRASYANAFKSPTMMELYFDWDHLGMFHIYGDSSLRPETAHQFMTGVDWSGDKVSLTADFMHTLFRDRIIQFTDEKGDVHHGNREGISRMNNLHLQASYRPWSGVTLTGYYVYVYSPSRLTQDGMQYDYNDDRPHSFVASARWYRAWSSRWSTSLATHTRFTSPLHYYYRAEKELPGGVTKYEVRPGRSEGYTTTRLSGSVTYRGRYTLSLVGDNVLNFALRDKTYGPFNIVPPISATARLSIALP